MLTSFLASSIKHRTYQISLIYRAN